MVNLAKPLFCSVSENMGQMLYGINTTKIHLGFFDEKWYLVNLTNTDRI